MDGCSGIGIRFPFRIARKKASASLCLGLALGDSATRDRAEDSAPSRATRYTQIGSAMFLTFCSPRYSNCRLSFAFT